MTTINSIPVTRQVSFGNQETNKPKKHPGAAVASFLLPGTGQFIKSKGDKNEKKKGFINLAVAFGIAAGNYILAKKTPEMMQNALQLKFLESFNPKKLYAGTPTKTKVIAAVLAAATLVQKVYASYDAYQPKASEETPKA